LLLYGELPSRSQFQLFEREVMHHTFVHRDLEEIIGAFRHDAHPMSILTSAFAALGAYAPEANPSLAGQKIYTSNTAAALQLMDKQIFRLVGKSITLAAMAYRVRQGRQFVSPPQGMTYSETFLYMMDHLNEPNYKPHPVIAKALDTLFLLHADVGLPRSWFSAGFRAIGNLRHMLALENTTDADITPHSTR
jgi:citrate synthase